MCIVYTLANFWTWTLDRSECVEIQIQVEIHIQLGLWFHSGQVAFTVFLYISLILFCSLMPLLCENVFIRRTMLGPIAAPGGSVFALLVLIVLALIGDYPSRFPCCISFIFVTLIFVLKYSRRWRLHIGPAKSLNHHFG